MRAVLGRRAAFPHVATALRCRAADNSADTNSGRPNRVGRLQLSPIAYPCPVEFSAREMSEAYVTWASCYSTGVRSSGAKRPSAISPPPPRPVESSARGMRSIFHRACISIPSGSALGGSAAALSPISYLLSSKRRATAFTLIELLVVISIIAILAALAFPAVNGALNSARKAEARNDVNQIASALRNFKLEYKRLPEEGTEIAVLRGENVNGKNPKELVFMEMKNAQGNPPKKGYRDGQMYDPWGVAYIVVLDGESQDSDGRINNKITRNGTEYITQVIVESEGGPANQQNRKPINNVQ